LRHAVGANALIRYVCANLVACTKPKSASGSLEDDFRALRVGAAFPHPELLDVAFTNKWVVAKTAKATGGSCRAYAVWLQGREDVPWTALAVFCDGDGLLTTENANYVSRAIPLEPYPGRLTGSTLRLDVHFVDALSPSPDVVWWSHGLETGGSLTALERAYVHDGEHLREVLSAVGADPSSSDSPPNGYRAAFEGEARPKRFLIHDDGKDMQYLYDGTGYQWDCVGSLASHPAYLAFADASAESVCDGFKEALRDAHAAARARHTPSPSP
jgi:hypothetical protein